MRSLSLRVLMMMLHKLPALQKALPPTTRQYTVPRVGGAMQKLNYRHMMCMHKHLRTARHTVARRTHVAACRHANYLSLIIRAAAHWPQRTIAVHPPRCELATRARADAKCMAKFLDMHFTSSRCAPFSRRRVREPYHLCVCVRRSPADAYVTFYANSVRRACAVLCGV